MGIQELRGRDLTSGSRHGDIWHLAVPMMLEIGTVNVIQVLDTYWVGRLGSEALAAVTMAVSIRWVITSLASGLGVGGLAVVARRIGEGDRVAADHAAPLVTLFDATPQVVDIGVQCLRVVGPSMIASAVGVALARAFDGAGNTSPPWPSTWSPCGAWRFPLPSPSPAGWVWA
jgi:Na+-driven multidrug efflux pump